MKHPKYKTIVISDVHLGTTASKVKELTRFLKYNSCQRLILNGDIIDGWQLRRSGKWKKQHSRFFKVIMKMMAKNDREVIYLRGNHDDFLDEIMPFSLMNFSIRKDYVLESGDKSYYIIHGDLFDSVTTNLRWLSKLGDIGYTALLAINRHYNNYRAKRGMPYYSLSQVVKAKVKSAVSYISDYETTLAEVARNKNCAGIICGHIHQPADKMIDGIHYLNSGDWVESLTALTETWDNEWKIITVNDWLEQSEPRYLSLASA